MNNKKPNIVSLILSDYWLSSHLFCVIGFSLMCIPAFVSKDPMIVLGVIFTMLSFMFLLLFIRRYNILNNLFKNGITVKGHVVSKRIRFFGQHNMSRGLSYSFIFVYKVNNVEYSAATEIYSPNFKDSDDVMILVNPKKPKQWYSIDKLYQLNNFISILKVIFHINKK